MANTFLLAERDRWPLWLAVALGAGAAGYFALPVEPPVVLGWGVLVLGLGAAVVTVRWHLRLGLVAALLLGFGLAKLREAAVATPLLDHPMVAHLTGRIASLEPREKGVRVVLDEIRSGALPQPPRRVRVALRAGSDFRPGEWLSLTARLDTPPAPSEPGANDLGRSLFFQSIGAVGFAYGKARVIVPAREPGLGQRIGAAVENLRLLMTRRIQAALPGSSGGIASALITGTRGGISDEDEEALRDAGLAHVLAIAGLHMALVGGGIFWLLRAVLAAIPAVALNHPIKKWAAAGALAAGSFYLVASGAAPSSVRAFVMLACVMVAVLLDRPALSMRSLALAAAILLLLRPEAIAEPGFQMSFAAVVGLVAVAEWEMRRQRTTPRGALYRYAHGIVMTSLVGSLATLPFALFHFERATHYAVLGNLIAMPVMGFWVMPAAALSVALMPLGLESAPLHLLGQGIGVMVAMGRWVSGLPGAVSMAPAMPLSALVAMSLGGLWLAIWRTRWRWWGLAPMAAGVALAWFAPLPDMLVAPDGATVALRAADGRLHFLRKPREKYAARDWLRRDGDARDINDAVGLPGLKCDGLGCVVDGKMVIAASLRPEAFLEDCIRAQVVVSVAMGHCKGPAVIIDGAAAANGQGWRITLSATPEAVSVRSYRGMRPWVVQY
ncbi:MAG: ComEC/Rec2 family competence protein [Alphaproteobacteria bacterium]|nr:ComEC/Rec2 family competence protein [Alphaproteobacteria bacterium]